ncbi:MAG TPA: head-tail joining protein [Blastocatellia bacterium]|nr:head-tail joining protein [Blastocatellia bacterium]
MFAEDLAQFFDPADFATTVAFTRGAQMVGSVSAIFTAASQSVEIYDAQIEEPNPTLVARSSEIAGIRRGDTATVGGSSFRVERISADGTGISTIYLAAL